MRLTAKGCCECSACRVRRARVWESVVAVSWSEEERVALEALAAIGMFRADRQVELADCVSDDVSDDEGSEG